MIAKLKYLLLNKCSLCIHIKVVFSNSQKPSDLSYDIFPLCNVVKQILHGLLLNIKFIHLR